MVRRVAILLCLLVAGCGCGFALNPELDISQYAHRPWTVRDGVVKGNIYAIAQTPDGYLWFGTEFGLVRFDGVRASPWQPPPGQHLPDRNITALLAARDGTLWIGTFEGLVSWNGSRLTRYPELDKQVVESLIEDREGTVWAGGMAGPTVGVAGRLCAMRSSSTKCYGEDGAFGRTVWALYEDSSGNVWACADSGLWRWKPGPPRRYPTPMEATPPGYSPFSAIDITNANDGRLIMAMRGIGLLQLAGNKVESYPVRGANNSGRLFRDRDGALWIGTADRGLIHVHRGRTDVFSRSNGLSSNGIFTIFEDREGNIWVGTNGGLDRFRDLPVTTISVERGLSSDATQSVMAARDGAIWIGTQGGLNRWKNGDVTVFRKASGLPDDVPESLFQDDRGRMWAFTRHGLAYFQDGRFFAVNGVPGGDVHYIMGDKAGNLWLSEGQSLLHVMDGRLVEQIRWPALGRRQGAGLVLCDRRGGLWLGFWDQGGVSYLKDGQLRASYTAANGLGEGQIGGLQLDEDGTLWAATQAGGLSRLKDGRIASLTSRNGLPCDTIHWSIEDDDRSLWLYTACGLVRIARTEVDAWIADPKRRIRTTVWDALDGVRLSSTPGSPYGPRVAKPKDGRLWFVTGEGVQVVDPHHLSVNKLPPPVHIEQIIADHKMYWQNLTGTTGSQVRLPPRIRDLQIDYTALSLVKPEKVHFKYMLEGQDDDWREVVNDREVQYSNLPPRTYRFRVIACNNSGVWNETGDSLEFSIDPAYYQTNWFGALCAAVFLALVWLAYQFRVRQLQEKFNLASEARLTERMRIARELHDTLLQTVQGLMLSLQAVSEMMPAGAAKNKFEKTLEIGDRAIREGRSTVQDLRSASTTSDLTQAVRALGDELASGDGAKFRLVVEGRMRELHPIVREEIYCIAREALRNAFNHACATRIEAEIGFNEHLLRLRIRDDGKGIAPEVAEQGSAGHYGMAGMRERARQINSKLVILSGPETGTEVELSVPGSVAYAKQQGRFRFTLFRRNGRAGL
jgi:signal transduction histidine kinase/ligand-binding sensor domain-containing protein